jgi:4-aminobutyrate aminotransferase-like enzyme
LLILDEIFTGFGRTGDWFACEHEGVIPDLICLGKALTGGFPLSACVGRAELMEAAWPKSRGEAIHTSTFLGHPIGCAMALAQIAEIQRLRLPDRSRAQGLRLMRGLDRLTKRSRFLNLRPRGRGLMVGLEVTRKNGKPATDEVWAVVREMMRRGFLILPEGEHGEVLGFIPPLTVEWRQLHRALLALEDALAGLRGRSSTSRRAEGLPP